MERLGQDQRNSCKVKPVSLNKKEETIGERSGGGGEPKAKRFDFLSVPVPSIQKLG
ncbi:hypothetical protein I79_007292 [Cricetulus griseus]|uniref:Uncharacterized protein n=1 Tax=Cricetulus griseus TaxID=10029 RepID=G3HA50_CRIGR|nr:hypothetical protein I79_007292 [Cricetulus griseus]